MATKQTDSESKRSGRSSIRKKADVSPSAANLGECTDAICRETLAAHVDTFVFETTFAPLLVPTQSKPKHVPPKVDFDFPGMVVQRNPFALARMAYVQQEVKDKIKFPDFNTFLSSVQISHDKKIPGADKLAEMAQDSLTSHARPFYQDLTRSLVSATISKLDDDDRSVSAASNSSVALQRMALRFASDHKVLIDDLKEKPAPKTRSAKRLLSIDSLGLLFLERLRIRPTGHTLERAPFYELSLQPGETVTLRQRSFSKRTVALERATEETEERRIEYSSTFTTELGEEYSHSLQDSSNWGITGTVSGTYGSAKGSNVSGQVGGNYGASSTETSTGSEASKKARAITRKVETSQKVSHKTVMTIGTEEQLEEESIKVIENDDTRAKKILMRKLMQVIHLSYERYGVRMCWAPCIKDPGRDVRAFIPGPDAFPEDIDAIREKWNNVTPPPEAGLDSPPNPKPCSHWTGKLSGGLGGTSYNASHWIAIPDGYAFADAILEKKDIDGSPNVRITQKPQTGTTGAVQVVVHVGLSGGLDAENINYRVCVLTQPDQESVARQNAAVEQWRQEQANNEVEEFLEQKREEAKGAEFEPWPASEVMRRVISEFFGAPSNYDNCEMVGLLQRIFEWENLSYELHAPWWNPSTQVDGLQSLRTTFLNASWVKVYVPLRPGSEELALQILLAIGGIPNNGEVLDQIEYYLHDMRQNVEPKFGQDYMPDAKDSEAISGPCDIALTTLGTAKWSNDFENEPGFIVLDRYTATIPTDGVDYEVQFARCDEVTPSSEAFERTRGARADAAEAVAQRIGKGDGEIAIEANFPPSSG